MSVPEAGKVTVADVAMYSGDVALVILEEVLVPENIDQAKIDDIKRQLNQSISNSEFEMALNAIKEKASVHINPKTLQ